MSVLVHLSVLVISASVGAVGGCTAYTYLLITRANLPDLANPAVIVSSAGPSIATAAALYAALQV